MTEHLEPAIDRWSTWILSALVVLTAIAFFPDLASPFFAAKSLVFFLGVALLFAVALFRGSRLFPIDPASRRLALCLVAFACLVLISTVASRWRYMSPNTVAWYLACLLLCWTGTLLSHRHLSSFLKCIAVAGSLVAAAALAQALIGHDFLFPLFGRSAQLFAGRMRLFSTLGNPNFVATYIAACCPAILAFGLRSSRLRQLAAFTWLCVLVAVVIMTGSRAGLLALIAGLSASLLMGPIPRRTSVQSIAIGLLLLLSLAHSSNRNPRSIGDSFAGRSLIWRATLSDSWFRPLGTGPGTFAYLYPSRVGTLLTQSVDADTQRFAGREEHALNDWVELWSDLGPLAYRKPGNAYDADRPHVVSEATAQRVDDAIRKVVLHGYDRAREIIVTNREPVRLLAEQLLVQESLEASEIRVLLAQAGARTESGQAVAV